MPFNIEFDTRQRERILCVIWYFSDSHSGPQLFFSSSVCTANIICCSVHESIHTFTYIREIVANIQWEFWWTVNMIWSHKGEKDGGEALSWLQRALLLLPGSSMHFQTHSLRSKESERRHADNTSSKLTPGQRNFRECNFIFSPLSLDEWNWNFMSKNGNVSFALKFSNVRKVLRCSSVMGGGRVNVK